MEPAKMISWLGYLKDILTYLVAIGTAVAAIRAFIMKPLKKQAELDKLQTERLNSLCLKLDALTEKVDKNQAEFCWDRLESMHSKYCDELKWCPAAEKERIIKWYTEYKAKGLDHLADTYIDDLSKLPEHPPAQYFSH